MSFQGKSVLIIEDEEEIREILHFYLENEGFRVDEASNGVVGIEKAKQTQYDLVITDLSMPGMKGETVIQNLKILSAKFKIVVSTGSLKYDGAEVDGTLFKPFNKDNVQEMLKKVFNS